MRVELIDGMWRHTARAVMVLASGGMLLAVPLPLPSPTLPTRSVTLPIATPSIPSVLPTVSPLAGATSRSSAPPVSRGATTGGASHANPTFAARVAPGPRHGISIPFTAFYVSSPLDVALLVAVATLPLMLAVWLFLAGRTFVAARRARDARTRLMVAAELGLRPRELVSMSTTAMLELRDMTAFDAVTGLLARAAGIAAADREVARARRAGAPLTVVFVELEGLEETNRDAGRAAGDDLLRSLAESLKRGLRSDDIVVRYGGGEFICVMPETGIRPARTRLEEIRIDFEAAAAGARFCSGFASLQRSDDVVALFARADADLCDFKARRGEIVKLPSVEKTPSPKPDTASA